MKKFRFILLFGLILFVFVVYVIKDFTKEVNVQVWDNPKLEDLDYFCNQLEKQHKNFYANIDKEEFQIEVEKIAEKTSTMTDAEFYYSLKYLLHKIGDAHTNVSFDPPMDIYKHFNMLGFFVSSYDDGWYLTKIEEKNNKYLGWKLNSINNIHINEVFERCKNIISYENEIWAKAMFPSHINTVEALEYLKIIKSNEKIILELEDSSGKKELLEIYSTDELKDINSLVTITRNSIPDTIKDSIYWSMELNKDNFFIQYNQCREDSNLPMKKFVSQVSEELLNNNYKNIIIDLRYNSGGNSSVLHPIIKELSKIQETTGLKVYTLIGKSTFSSGIINAIQTVGKLNSTLVGSPTGGNVNGYGELKFFNLKNSNLIISHSTKYFELIKGYTKDSLYPDIFIEQRFDDYINGIDKEVDYILNLN